MVEIMDRPDAVTPEWMTQALRQSGHLPVGHVVALTHQLIGTGKMGDNARFTLQYEGGQGPATVVGKFPAADETARQMGGAQGAYYNEVMFYRLLADRTRMSTPTIYANEISADRCSFILLMEDLAPAEPGSQLVGATRGQTRLAAEQAARLAAAFYGDERLAECDFVMKPARDGSGELTQTYLQQCWPLFLQRFGDALTDECRRFGEYYVTVHNHFATRYSGPRTLAHGDLRSENLLFRGEEQCWVVDWQTMIESSPLTDIAYFLGSSLTVEDRRAWEREVIAEYRDLLAAEGVELPLDACWEQYCEQAMHGLTLTILGACFSSPDERGDAMFRTMIQRQLQHCVDLNAAQFLP